MVDLADLSKATQLSVEADRIRQAIANVDNNGAIVGMSIAPPMPPEMVPGTVPMRPSAVFVSTEGWTYPPTMTAAISALLQTRLQQIETELSQLGVTGVTGAAR